MPSWPRTLNLILFACLSILPLTSMANSFAVQISQAELVEQDASFAIRAQIHYRLSPTAKEALHKGIPLTWLVLVEIREIGRLWDSAVYSQELPYHLKFHALLTQYEVITPNKQGEMFLTLNAALSYLSSLRGAAPVPRELLRPGHHYKLAMKCLFDRESLPVPLRPFAYLDNQWYLSSDWYIWLLRK